MSTKLEDKVLGQGPYMLRIVLNTPVEYRIIGVGDQIEVHYRTVTQCYQGAGPRNSALRIFNMVNHHMVSLMDGEVLPCAAIASIDKIDPPSE